MKRIRSITTYLTAGVMLATALLIFFCPFGFGASDAMAMSPAETTLCSGTMIGHAMGGGAARPCIPSHAALSGYLTGTLPDIMAVLLAVLIVAAFAVPPNIISKAAIPRSFFRFRHSYRTYRSGVKPMREQKLFRWLAIINDPAIAFSS